MKNCAYRIIKIQDKIIGRYSILITAVIDKQILTISISDIDLDYLRYYK